MAALQSGLTPAVLKKYKFVFLGDIAVGKTSIINQFMYGTFDQTHQATIGIDFLSKTMYLDDRTIRLQLWDTAGQERFRSLIPNYIRDCSVAIIVFDISQRSSFNSLEKWVQDVRNERGGDVVIMVAGNKIDLVEKRTVSPEDCEAKARELNVQYMEVSAKTGANIKQLFKALAQELPLAQETSLANPPESSTGRVKLSEQPQPQQKTKEGKCC